MQPIGRGLGKRDFPALPAQPKRASRFQFRSTEIRGISLYACVIRRAGGKTAAGEVISGKIRVPLESTFATARWLFPR
jgi:hypothetical protein